MKIWSNRAFAEKNKVAKLPTEKLGYKAGFHGGMADWLQAETDEEMQGSVEGNNVYFCYLVLCVFVLYITINFSAPQEGHVESVKTRDGDILVMYKVGLNLILS